MKKFGLFLCFWLAGVALSCVKEDEAYSVVDGSEVVGLTVRVVANQTKVTDTSSESDIESLQVFIFSDDALESVAYSDSAAVSLRCFSGFKYVYAVVNNPEILWTPKMTVSDLENSVVTLSEKKTWNVMVGSDNIYASAGGDGIATTITVKRLASRVSLGRVINNTMLNDGEEITVHCAYLTNVVGAIALSGPSSSLEQLDDSDMWYNKMGNEGDLPTLLYSGELDETLGLGGDADFGQFFYCYPNPTENDVVGDGPVHSSWSPRFTRLVVEAYYKGVLNYYPVTISGLSSNLSYSVTLVIDDYGYGDAEGSLEHGSQGDFGGGDGNDGEEEEDDDRFKDDPNKSARRSSVVDDGCVVISFKGGYAELRESVL